MRASYPTYKSTSIPWLPEMPEHWELRRNKYLLKEINERSLRGEEDLLSVSQYTGVTLKKDRLENEGDLLTTASTLEGYKVVRKDDLVINIMLAWNGSMGVSDYDGIASPAYCVYRFGRNINPRYYHYLFRTDFMKLYFRSVSSGVIESRLRMYTDDFYRLYSFLPPLPEQTAIANYLDAKTEQINRFIEKKEKLIALLKEQKQAVINELLEDKDGKWERRKLKYCVKSIVSGGTPSMDNKLFWQNGTIPWVSPKDMKLMFINNTEMNVTEFAVNSTVLKIIPSGSILIVVRSGILQRTIPIAFNSVPVTVNQDLKAITLNDGIIDPLYFYYFVKGFERKILSLCRKVVATVDSLEMTDLLNYKLIIPPIEKQRELTLKTKESLQRIDKTISQIEKEIEKVKELKQSLIAELVTGKIKII